jgi:polyhydroxyalkanoate synthase
MPDSGSPVRVAAPTATPHVTTPYVTTEADLDQQLHAWQSRFTGGLSPSTVALACLDWAAHAANSPFEAMTWGRSALQRWQDLLLAALGGPPAIVPPLDDHRFLAPAWQRRPYSLLAQALLLQEAWWDDVISSQQGASETSRHTVTFTVRQCLDMLSPSNNPWLNPEVLEAVQKTGGRNLIAGLENFLRDQAKAGPSGFKVGQNLAVTPGKVVFRNDLIELIQYTPATAKVAAEPVLVVPAWIMKYYILDLSPGNSLIRWLVGQGHTVFAISWRSPNAGMRETSLDDYRANGVMAALDAIEAICGDARIHATGYCLGGTLMTITAATMARDDDHRLASLSLFAAQTDFTEAGNLRLFISEDQLDFLGDVMKTQGYLSSEQMGGTFTLLQARDLLWTRAIRAYLLGERDAPNDLAAWNIDGTRMPARMHIEYLRSLFLHNDLAEGRFKVGGHPLALDDLKLPMFVVGTERDTIAPWRSVFKLHLLNDGDLTFVLTSGGHNAGIVSEPGHPRRHFRLRVRPHGGRTLGPDDWEATTTAQSGSWWTAWGTWLNEYSGAQVDPPPMGGPGFMPLCDAPGTYVLEK